MIQAAVEATKQEVMKKIELFGSTGKGRNTDLVKELERNPAFIERIVKEVLLKLQ